MMKGVSILGKDVLVSASRGGGSEDPRRFPTTPVHPGRARGLPLSTLHPLPFPATRWTGWSTTSEMKTKTFRAA